MRTLVLVLLLVPTFQVAAWSNFFENPYAPYPAGCSDVVEADWIQFHEQTVTLLSTWKLPLPMVLKAYRAACAEPGRSQIFLRFTAPNDRGDYFLYTPSVRVVSGGAETLTLSLARESGSWNEGNGSSAYPSVFGLSNCEGNDRFCSETGWTFLLDNSSPLGSGSSLQYLMTAEEYNRRFTLELQPSPGAQAYRIEVPSTAELLAELPDSKPAMAFSGRLSGLWVVEGAPDQGFNIAISDMTNGGWWPVYYLFLTWYTFDADGQPLWLSGGAPFGFGEREISFPLVLTTDGEFSGEKAASRQTLGNVTLKANDCNDLGLDYDLQDLGLGAGSTRLQRLYSLELSGYACRDMAARRANLQ